MVNDIVHSRYNDKVVDVGLTPDADGVGLPPNLTGDPGFSQLARVGALCSRAKFLAGQEDVPVMKQCANF